MVDIRIKKNTREILNENLDRESPLAHSFILFAHNIRSMHNVGALFRTSDAFGIHSLFLSGFTPTPPRPEISKTALGSEETVSWKKIENPLEEIDSLKHKSYKIYGLEQTFQSKLLTEFKIQEPEKEQKICVILGNEVTGIDEVLIDKIDRFIEIPQFGSKHSLNVSVAAGVLLYAFLEKMN